MQHILTVVAQQHLALLHRCAEHIAEVDSLDVGRSLSLEVVAHNVGLQCDVAAGVFRIVGQHREIVGQFTSVEVVSGRKRHGDVLAVAVSDVTIGARQALDHRLGGSHNLDGTTRHDIIIRSVDTLVGRVYETGVGEYTRIVGLDIAHAHEVVATTAKHTCRIIVVVINLDATVRTKGHVETERCCLTATLGGRCHHILKLNIEFAILVAVRDLTVAAHVHPTRVGIGRYVAETLHTVARRHHARDASLDGQHAQTAVRRDVNLIVLLAVERELEADLDRTRLPVVAIELRGDVLFVGQLRRRLIFERIIITNIRLNGITKLVDTCRRTIDLGRRILREHVLQRILARVLQRHGSGLCLTAHLQVAEVELTVSHLKGCRGRSHTAHDERVLDAVLVGQSDVAGEIASLCRLECHRQLAGRTSRDVLHALRHIKLIGRRLHILLVLQVAIFATKHAVSTVGQLHIDGLLLTHEQVAKINELLTVQLRQVALDRHGKRHLLLRLDRLVGLHMDVELIGSVDELLSVVLKRHRLALAWAHLTAYRLRVEHLAPIGICADGLHGPCEMVGYGLEA